MRITEQQRKAIVESACEVFGEQVTVRLFGSRADDTKRGGDIDLYVTVGGEDAGLQNKASVFYARICNKLGDILPIDVVVKDDATPTRLIDYEGSMGISL